MPNPTATKLPEGWRAFLESDDVEPIEVCPGYFRRTLLSGGGLMLVLFDCRKGYDMPEHSHPHDQSGYVVSGEVELTIAGEKHLMRAGSTYFVASNQLHSARTLEDAVIVDAFSPPREDYLPGAEGGASYIVK